MKVIQFSIKSCFSSAFVRMFVRQRDNSWTAKDRTAKDITIFSGHHPRVQREAKFESGYIVVHGWLENGWYIPVYLEMMKLVSVEW